MTGIVLIVVGAGMMAYGGYTFASTYMEIRNTKADPNLPERSEAWAKEETRKAVMRLVVIDLIATAILIGGVFQVDRTRGGLFLARIYMIRHGEAEAGWGEDRDPGLSARGTVQASEVAERLVQLGPLDVVSSPLKRCRETSAPLCDAWRTSPRIETAVAEIVSPTQDLTSRSAWLRKIFEGNWADTEDVVQQWKRGVPEALLKLRNDTVVSTILLRSMLRWGPRREMMQWSVFGPIIVR